MHGLFVYSKSRRQSQTADFVPGVQFVTTVYDDKVKQWRNLKNTLEIYDYLMQLGADVDSVNASRRTARDGKT